MSYTCREEPGSRGKMMGRIIRNPGEDFKGKNGVPQKARFRDELGKKIGLGSYEKNA